MGADAEDGISTDEIMVGGRASRRTSASAPCTTWRHWACSPTIWACAWSCARASSIRRMPASSGSPTSSGRWSRSWPRARRTPTAAPCRSSRCARCARRARAPQGHAAAREHRPGAAPRPAARHGAELRRRHRQARHPHLAEGGLERAARARAAALVADPRRSRRSAAPSRKCCCRRCWPSCPKASRSADAIVECKAGELLQALDDDLDVKAQLRDPAVALEQALLYLHDTEVLDPGQGPHRVPLGDDAQAARARRARSAS